MTRLDKIQLLIQLLIVDPALVKRNTKSIWLSIKLIKQPFNGILFNLYFSLPPMLKYIYTASYKIETYLFQQIICGLRHANLTTPEIEYII